MRKPWTKLQLRLLAALYADTPTKDIVKACGHSFSSVYQRAGQLGLKKSAKFRASAASGILIKGTSRGAAYRFRKGNRPFNAGMKGWQAGGRSSTTQFKPGDKPINWKPIGADRVTQGGILERKIQDTGCTRRDYVAVHVLVWREINGPVPKGHIVVFSDRNRRNFAPSNLLLISRAENMRRNSIHNLPPPLKSAVHLLGQLNRRIREKQDRRSA